jgi:hypothetical protein
MQSRQYKTGVPTENSTPSEKTTTPTLESFRAKIEAMNLGTLEMFSLGGLVTITLDYNTG